MTGLVRSLQQLQQRRVMVNPAGLLFVCMSARPGSRKLQAPRNKCDEWGCIFDLPTQWAMRKLLCCLDVKQGQTVSSAWAPGLAAHPIIDAQAPMQCSVAAIKFEGIPNVESV